MIKSLKIVILFLSVLTFAFGSQAAAAQKSGDGNAIPYPKKEWKGVQGKTLADSKPDFVGPPKAPEGGSGCSHFAVLPSATADGHALVGQNEDSGLGDLDLRLLPGAAFELRLETSSGDVEATLPLEVSQITRQRLRARLGDGGGRAGIDLSKRDPGSPRLW